MKGQGTIEYLVILAVIVVISLIVVSLMINSTEPAGNISSGVDKISAQTGWIAVSDAVADSEGDAVITLSPKENVTIKTVTIEGEEYVIPDTKVFAGNSQPILLSGLPPCSSGTSSYTIDLISGVNDNDLPVAVSDIRISVECIENVSEDSITNDNYIEGTIFIPTYTLSDCAVLDSKGFYNLEADITNVDDTCFEIIGSDITLNGNGHKISFANKGTGNFYLFDSLTSTQRPWGVSSGDLDNDGDLDLVFANLLAEESFLNDGKANFINTGFLGNGGNQADNIILGDFDGDGFLDYITAGWWTNNQLYLGDGTGFFDWSWTDSLGAKTHSLCIGDFDNDGDLDHFSADYDQYSSTDGLVYLNNGDGTFTPGWGAPSGYTYSAESTDFDKDGNLDLVVGSYSGPAITYVFLGDGTGGFSLSWSTPHQSRDVAIGDFDGDGYQDFVGTIFNDKSLIQFGDGTGQFSNDVNINGTGSTFEIGVADFDGDGDLDLLVGRNNQTNIIYENDGTGHFSNILYTTPQTDSTYDIAIGDFDGDGDNDFATTTYSYGTSYNRIYLNISETSTDNNYSAGVHISGGSNVTVSDLTIEHFPNSLILESSSDTNLYNNSLVGATLVGLKLNNATGNTIIENNSSEGGVFGLELRNSNGLTLNNNSFCSKESATNEETHRLDVYCYNSSNLTGENNSATILDGCSGFSRNSC